MAVPDVANAGALRVATPDSLTGDYESLTRDTRSRAACAHVLYLKSKPAARRRPGTTRRLFSQCSVSERIANAPSSAIHLVAGRPTGTPHPPRNSRMKSRCGSGLGAARLTGPDM